MDILVTSAIKELTKLLVKNMQDTESTAQTNDVALMNREAQKQTFELQLAHSQAKVAQEIAIARRIETASEVIIEEYFEGEGKGRVGINADEAGLSLGASADGRKVTKRVYRFVGGAAPVETTDLYEQET